LSLLKGLLLCALYCNLIQRVVESPDICLVYIFQKYITNKATEANDE